MTPYLHSPITEPILIFSLYTITLINNTPILNPQFMYLFILHHSFPFLLPNSRKFLVPTYLPFFSAKLLPTIIDPQYQLKV